MAEGFVTVDGGTVAPVIAVVSMAFTSLFSKKRKGRNGYTKA